MWNHTSPRKTNKLDKGNRKHGHKNRRLIDSLDLTEETRNEIKLQNQNKRKNDEERNVREWNKHLDYLMNLYKQEQNDNSLDNLLKFVGQKHEENETTLF